MTKQKQGSVNNNSQEMSNLGSFEDINFSEIENRRDLFKKIAWEKQRTATFIFIFISILTAIAISFYHFPLIIVSPIPYLAYLAYCSFRAQNIFMESIAEKNSLRFQKTINIKDVKGNLFKVPYAKKITNVITSRYKNKKARFFHYSYTISSGKNSVTFFFTVFEVFFSDVVFPHTLLHYRNKFLFNRMRHGAKGKDEVKVSLEDEFSNHYNLYIKDGYGVEAMQVFSREFLQFLVDEECNFSIELAEDRMYIYVERQVIEKKHLEELFNTANETVKRITPILKRLKRDFTNLNDTYNRKREKIEK